MKNKIKFSIIVPIYNVEDYIDQCINSILNQSFTNFELILVDDGSPDNCGKICDNYKSMDKRIKVIHQENAGLSAARNSGICNSSGEYLMFVDGDDFLYSTDSLEKISSAIDKYQSDIIQYKMIYLYGQDKFVNQKDIKDVNSIDDKNSVLNILNQNGNVSVSACDKVMKKEIIDKNDLLFEKDLLSEDVKWSYLLYLKVKSIKILNESIYVYRQQRQGSITTSKTIKNMLDMYKIVKYWIDFDYKNNLDKSLYYNMISYWYLILRTNFSSKNYTNEMISFFKKYDNFILKYNDNYKVKKASKVAKIFGVNLTIIIMKVYIFLKNRGIIKL